MATLILLRRWFFRKAPQITPWTSLIIIIIFVAVFALASESIEKVILVLPFMKSENHL